MAGVAGAVGGGNDAPPPRGALHQLEANAAQPVHAAFQHVAAPVDGAALPVQPQLAIEQAARLADDSGKLTLQARGPETGSSVVEMELPDYDGPEVEIAFDPSFITEMLRAVDSELTVMMEITEARDRAILETLYSTGCRVSECAGMPSWSYSCSERFRSARPAAYSPCTPSR